MSRSALKGIQAAAGAAGGALYVDDVFSTYLWEGDGTEETVTNNIDLDGEEGIVWTKTRSTTNYHELFYKNSGSPVDGTSRLSPNQTSAENNGYTGNLAVDFLSDGFSFGSTLNTSGTTFASWTFRKASKFFDIVTWTGNSTAGRTVSHNLGSVPGMIIIKCTNSSAEPWYVYHRETDSSAPEDYHLNLNTSSGRSDSDEMLNDTAPTSTEFTVSQFNSVNGSGNTYIAYLFAHNDGDGEFGEDGDQDIIKCGSYTGDGGAGTTEVNLGFEPQWIIVKASSATDPWFMIDNMRGWATESNTSNDAVLRADNTNAESTGGYLDITATGFKTTLFSNVNVSGRTYIYMAIRRPMKTPESGTEVFAIDNAANGLTSGFPVDWFFRRSLSTSQNYAHTRLCGETFLTLDSTDVEQASSPQFDNNTGVFATLNNSAIYGWMFRRAPGFFDVVAYTGTGSDQNVSHNLGVAPEAVIVKKRSGAANWTWSSNFGGTLVQMELNLNSASSPTDGYINSVTSTTFTTGGSGAVISTGGYIAYLFASVDGISKVGSYTGTGNNVDVNCGFSAGARFVLIKRTDSTGDWYLWDSERGIVVGNDPYIVLNGTGEEVTSTDYIDPLSSGFTVPGSISPELNASGGNYIFLAIA
jgi:hypothetical protein